MLNNKSLISVVLVRKSWIISIKSDSRKQNPTVAHQRLNGLKSSGKEQSDGNKHSRVAQNVDKPSAGT